MIFGLHYFFLATQNKVIVLLLMKFQNLTSSFIKILLYFKTQKKKNQNCAVNANFNMFQLLGHKYCDIRREKKNP